MQRKLKIDDLITKQKKLSAQCIAKTFKGFSVDYVFKKLQKLKFTLADYQVKEIICSMDFKTS